jgi:hypothetical protein
LSSANSERGQGLGPEQFGIVDGGGVRQVGGVAVLDEDRERRVGVDLAAGVDRRTSGTHSRDDR